MTFSDMCNEQFFLVFYVYFNQFNTFLYLCVFVWGKESNVIRFHSLIKKLF